jgi:hypothetical protein
MAHNGLAIEIWWWMQSGANQSLPANWEKAALGASLQLARITPNPDKSLQISRVWMEVSLLKEQGDYHSSAGT